LSFITHEIGIHKFAYDKRPVEVYLWSPKITTKVYLKELFWIVNNLINPALVVNFPKYE